MKARGEKRYPFVGAVLEERKQALCPYGAKEGIKMKNNLWKEV